MPTRASVKRTSNPLEGIETECQALLERFAGQEDHATVRVGSAAMSAPFAFGSWSTDFFPYRARSWTQISHNFRPMQPAKRRLAQRKFAYCYPAWLFFRNGEGFPSSCADLLRPHSELARYSFAAGCRTGCGRGRIFRSPARRPELPRWLFRVRHPPPSARPSLRRRRHF